MVDPSIAQEGSLLIWDGRLPMFNKKKTSRRRYVPQVVRVKDASSRHPMYRVTTISEVTKNTLLFWVYESNLYKAPPNLNFGEVIERKEGKWVGTGKLVKELSTTDLLEVHRALSTKRKG
jgi:hypothetical protein